MIDVAYLNQHFVDLSVNTRYQDNFVKSTFRIDVDDLTTFEFFARWEFNNADFTPRLMVTFKDASNQVVIYENLNITDATEIANIKAAAAVLIAKSVVNENVIKQAYQDTHGYFNDIYPDWSWV